MRAAVAGHVRQAQLLQTIVQFVEMLVEKGQHVLRRAAAVVAQRGAPDPVAFRALAVVEEVGKAGDQVGLGEDHVHRRVHAQALGEFLDPRAQALGQLHRSTGRAARQLGHAHRDQDAVDRRTAAVLFQQVEEAEPLVAVAFLHRVAAGGVEQDAVGGKEPVAVAGAAHALHRLAAGDREGQPRMRDGAALAGRGVPDDHVPGQLVQGFGAARQAQLRGLDGVDRFQHVLAQHRDFAAAAVGGCSRFAGRQAGRQAFRGADAPQPPCAPEHAPQRQQGQRRDECPDQADFEGVGSQQQEAEQCGDADHDEHAAVGEELPETGHGGSLCGLWKGRTGNARTIPTGKI